MADFVWDAMADFIQNKCYVVGLKKLVLFFAAVNHLYLDFDYIFLYCFSYAISYIYASHES